MRPVGLIKRTRIMMAKLIASNTNYAAMISGPSAHQAKIKLLQLSRMDEKRMLVVIVVEGNIISNKIITVDRELSDAEILNLNILLNTSLNGLTINEINLDVIRKLKEDAGDRRDLVENVLNELAESFREDEDLQIYTSGATNIFKYPELTDGESASRIINTFEEKDKLKEILKDMNPPDGEDGDGPGRRGRGRDPGVYRRGISGAGHERLQYGHGKLRSRSRPARYHRYRGTEADGL